MTGPRSSSVRLPRHVLGGLVLGAALGGLVVVKPALGVVALGGAGAVAAAFAWPPVLVLFMYGGILFDRLGVTGAKLGDFPITASKLSVVAGLGLWTLYANLGGKVAVRWHPVLTALLGVAATTTVTMMLANSMTAGKFTLFGLVMMTVMVGLVYAILAEARLDALYRVFAVILIAALAAAVVRPGADGPNGRVAGTMGDPNEWATTVLLVAPPLIGGLVDDDSALGRPLRIALVVLAPLAILRSESRAALVVLALILPGCLWVLRRRAGEVAGCAVAAVLAAPMFIDLDAGFGRFQALVDQLRGNGGADDASFSERSELFRQGLQLFEDHWFIGAGPGNFETATGFISHEGTLRPAHNSYLEIASEQGVVGLAAALVFLATVGWTVYRAWVAARRPRDRARLLGVGLGLGAFAVMAATLGLITFAMGYLVLGLALATVHQAGRADVVAA